MEGYVGQQYIGIDLHRRRSVIVRTADTGDVLEAVQITNSPLALAEVMTRAGEHPEIVLESTYVVVLGGRPRAGLACEPGVHLAHPLGVKAFEYRLRGVQHDDHLGCLQDGSRSHRPALPAASGAGQE